jgi:ribonuclease J
MSTNKIEIIDASVRTKRSQNIKRQAGSNESSAEAVKRTAKPAKKNTARRKEPVNKKTIKIAFLGGLNEVGKNMTLYEYGGDMFLVDCGLSFPDQDMLGVDLVIPDFTYIEQNKSKIRGVFITHGHEDHIGGIAYLLRLINVPIYGTKLSIGLLRGKLREHGLLNTADLIEIKPGDKTALGGFSVECIHVNHSIPGAVSFAIRCGGGTVVQTGDFKIDNTPIDGEIIDLARFAEIGKEGVLCLLSDSTNAERPGFTESERKVGESFENLFHRAGNRRLIIATFASNIHRVQQIMDVAQRLGRKVALSGRSLENVVSISEELGYLHVPEGLLISIDMVNRYPADKLVIITTGSQGEPLSALSRMAFSEHRKVEICPNDCVIISATPIPGNEKTVGKVINELLKLGAEVIYEQMYEVHVSGHACQEELKIIMGIVKPKFFIPVHGEQKHLRKHSALAKSIGISPENILIADNGNVVELTASSMRFGANVPAGRVFVDGYGVGDVGSIVLKDRRHLAQDGLVIVAAVIDSVSGHIVSGPDIITRGFVYERGSESIIEEAKQVVSTVITDMLLGSAHDVPAAKSKLRDAVSRLMYEKTKRSPMIFPVILEV